MWPKKNHENQYMNMINVYHHVNHDLGNMNDTLICTHTHPCTLTIANAYNR